MNRHDILLRGFTLAHARFLDSRKIWLAVDDSLHESRRARMPETDRVDALTLHECDQYHKQLFYWLLIRSGLGIFPAGTELCEGVPRRLHPQN